MNKRLYREHIEFMNSITNMDDITDEESRKAFKRLLNIIPNKGKLYKYKSGIGESYQNTVKSLKNNYIWMTNVKKFNDRFDSTINFDYEKEQEELIHYLKNNKQKIFQYYLKRERENPETHFFSYSEFHNSLLSIASNHINNEGQIDMFGLTLSLKNKVDDFTNELPFEVAALAKNAFSDMLLHYDEYINELANSLHTLNYDRNNAHIFCMCEKYNLNSMWAHYCKNSGLVIEYDFNKALDSDINTIKKCLSLYIVKYQKKPKFNLAKVFERVFNNENKNVVAEDTSIVTQMTSKDCSWSFEKEWRIVLLNIKEQFPLDIVSAIYIDYELFNQKKCQPLIKLANKRKWKIYVRTPNKTNSDYDYIQLVVD